MQTKRNGIPKKGATLEKAITFPKYHPWDERYIFTYMEWLIFLVNACKYASPMDAMSSLYYDIASVSMLVCAGGVVNEHISDVFSNWDP